VCNASCVKNGFLLDVSRYQMRYTRCWDRLQTYTGSAKINSSVHKVLVAVGKMQEKMDNTEERMSSHQKETESEIRKVSARQVNFELEMARLKETIDNEFVEVHKNMQGIKNEME